MVKSMHHEDNKAVAAGQELDEHKPSEPEPKAEKELAKSQK